jgi:pilus assembly protein CpaB
VRTVLVILLALVFGVSAALGINTLREVAPTPTLPETVPVVVAGEDLPRFATLSASQLRTRDYPKELVPPGALTRPVDCDGRVTLSQIVKDEPILESRLAARGSGRGMGPGIPPGKRAFTIQTPNVSSGVAGFILPGSKVDVLLTVAPPDPQSSALTVPLLQNVEILAVDQRVDIPAENKVDVKELRSVTLLVTPEEAAKLDLGQNKGTLHLALRNPEDTHVASGRRISLADIGLPMPEKEKTVPVPAAAPPKEEPRAAPALLQIRTAHGSQQGTILLQPVPPGGGR